MKEELKAGSYSIHPAIALGVGVLLWFVPTLLLPIVGGPIEFLLRSIGLLAQSASEFERSFTAALVLRWVAVVLLLVFVLGMERLPFASLGIRMPGWPDIFIAIGAGVVSFIVGVAFYSLFQGPESDTQTQTDQIISTLPLFGRLHLIFNAAIVEEIFFRGFLIERLTTLTRRLWVGVLVSFALFVVSHISGSGVTMTLTMVTVGALTLVLLYLWRRNLFVCILAHAVGNLPMLLS